MTMVSLIANGTPPPKELLQEPLIAIDGGANICHHYGIRPEEIWGDFDSIQPNIFPHTPRVHLKEQNHSDLDKSVTKLFETGQSTLIVFGALGRRIDHTLSNILLLTKWPGRLFYVTAQETLYALPTSAKISVEIGTTLSLIPLSQAEGVTTTGLKWNLQQETLGASYVGISNMAESQKISISFARGDLLISINRKIC